ncbi:NAD(P)/FAD-dependent oxidoreductase [Granulosicoccus sp. 3-233]|uniref:NAD(P)/FAD-dependent oxidoreductase n=1 Tax=Granulosicoccus sp. 3-233 TaxID=3417969 RepID=UPI003D332DD2
MVPDSKKHIAVVGSGAAGMSAAWLLSRSHRVTLLEKDDRIGGHAHTATIPGELHGGQALGIDTGFIVYNEPSYPNLTRWFEALQVATEDSDMSFAVSRDNGNFEYAGGPLLGLLAQPGLPLKPRFWRMLLDLLRFYREAPNRIPADGSVTLGAYLQANRYSQAFIDDHLLPFGAAIWSTPKQQMLDYPAASFIRFCSNHGLLQISNRPQWKTVTGGSQSYVRAVADIIGHDAIQTGFAVQKVERRVDGITVHAEDGRTLDADELVLATHADQALACLESPSEREVALLSPFRYESNQAYLHTDISYLPKRRRAWCSWNYVEQSPDDTQQVSLSYWMNRLQNLRSDTQFVVTLNPDRVPDDACVLRSHTYEHPLFNADTWQAQQALWSLQGQNRTWYCGSYFGSGFHEDAVQSGLAVAEQLGGLERPWKLENPSSRIVLSADADAPARRAAA